MIVGMGVDIAEVERIKAGIERYCELFLRRIFTLAERTQCESFRNKFQRYAECFAAKEATMKALGTGWGKGVHWTDIEVVRQKDGSSSIGLYGNARSCADQLAVSRIAVSVTHTSGEALAEVIFES